MKKEGLLYPTCLSVFLGWAAFFAGYDLMARDAEITIVHCREILTSMPAVSGETVKEKEDLADVALLEHRRVQTLRALEEAEGTTDLAAMASAAIAAAAGVFIFTVAKPRRARRKKPPG